MVQWNAISRLDLLKGTNSYKGCQTKAHENIVYECV